MERFGLFLRFVHNPFSASVQLSDQIFALCLLSTYNGIRVKMGEGEAFFTKTSQERPVKC